MTSPIPTTETVSSKILRRLLLGLMGLILWESVRPSIKQQSAYLINKHWWSKGH